MLTIPPFLLKLKEKRIYFPIIVLVLLCGGLISGSILVRQRQLVKKKAAEPVSTPLIAVRGPGSVQTGQEFAAVVSVDTGLKDIGAIDVVLNFPQDKFSLQDIQGYDVTQVGTSLKTFMPLNSPGTVFDKGKVISEASSSGQIKFGAVTFNSATGTTTSPFNSNGLEVNLLTLNFLVKNNAVPGSATISVSHTPGLNTDSNLIFSSDGKDVLERVVSCPVVINTVLTPTPTQTAQPVTLVVTRPLRVFVTSQTYSGNLGGLTGADSKCQALANSVGMTGSFKAWLSTSTVNAKDRLTKHNRSYIQVYASRVTAHTIANNWADLVDGSLQKGISLDERGTAVASGTRIWTGTIATGEKTPFLCSDWTSAVASVVGKGGKSGSTISSWSYGYTSGCSNKYRLYCIED